MSREVYESALASAAIAASAFASASVVLARAAAELTNDEDPEDRAQEALGRIRDSLRASAKIPGVREALVAALEE